VRRAKDGDREALAALCERHHPRLERIARRILRDPEDARDAAQDAIVRACQRIGQFRAECALTTWLHRLTVNACLDLAARAAARPTVRLEDDERAAVDDDPVRAAELADLRRVLADGLASLPSGQARVLVLKDGLGLTFPEISAADGMPVGTAKCYAHRARAGMRAVLEEAAA
jgi:RNA polymerase sigma-70 factor (ECF subfamily)